MTRPPPGESRRDRALETLRGIASVTVLFWHNILAYYPQRSGIYPVPDFSTTFASRIWFGLVFGSSAVVFFFVLSGFVLTRAFFLTGDGSILERNAIKRWPRLGVPVLATVLASWLLLRTKLYFHQPAAVISQSWWLWYFGNAATQPIEPSFLEAFSQGAYRTFLHGDGLYDSSLWTMRYEFFGSFFAMGLALLVRPLPRTSLRAYLIAVTVAMAHYSDPQYAAFPAGVALAAFLPEAGRVPSRALSVAAVLFGVYCLGYAGYALGAFVPFVWAVKLAVPPTYVHIVGSLVLIMIAERSPWLHAALSKPWGVFLGRLSFPLYLVHVPVICSIGAFSLVKLTLPLGPRALPAAMAIGMVSAFIVAYPLTVLSERWVAWLNQVVARMLPRTRPLPAVE